MSRLCVAGIWHLGAVASACLAELGHHVVGVAEALGCAVSLNNGVPPLFEPGLAELMARCLASGHLRFTSSLEEGVEGSSHVVIAYDTKANEQDEGDLAPIIATVEALAGCLDDSATIIVSSQVPVGTCTVLAERLRRLTP